MFFNFKNDTGWAEHLILVSQLGFTMVGSIMLCFFVGYYLDKWLGTKAVFTIIFIILGVIGGGVTVYRQIMTITEDTQKETKDHHNGFN